MAILLLIGIILIRNLVGKTYTHDSGNNCSQTFFDEATLNYMASFKFVSENIDVSCPNTKAIAFKKPDLVVIEMELKILDSIWTILNKKDRLHLMYQLRHRLHYSCNSMALTTELCRTNYALDGGVFISAYDGSLLKQPFQKSCSICLLRIINDGVVIQPNEDISPVFSRVNLSLFDVVDGKELLSDDILTVKFTRSRNEHKSSFDRTLQSMLGASFPNKSILLSDVVTYNVRVMRQSGRSHIISKEANNSSVECLFRCDWSSKCLVDVKKICDNKWDCRYGDDENTQICQLYNILNQNYKKNSSARSFINYDAVLNKSDQNEANLKFIIPVIFSVLVLVIAAIGITIVFRRNKLRKEINKKMSHTSNINFSKIHLNSIYLQRSSIDELTAHPSLHEMLINSEDDKRMLSRWCLATIHHKSKNNGVKQFIHPKSFRKQEKSEKFCSEQYSDLCEQINYPDTKTRANWLRTYFQLSKSNNVNQNKPPVLNISHFPPVSFNCKQ